MIIGIDIGPTLAQLGYGFMAVAVFWIALMAIKK